MPTIQQINDFKLKARAKGFSEQQISDSIAKKITADAGAGGSGVTKTTTTPQKGFFTKVGETLIRPLADYTKFIGEAVGQGIRATASDIGVVGALDKKSQEFSKKSRELIKQASKTDDPTERKRLLDQSRAIDAQIDELGQRGAKVGAMKPSLLLDEKKIATRGDILKTGVKATAGAAAYAVPAGATLKSAAGLGAISGALFGLSEGEDISVDDIISGAVGGAVGGAAIYGGGKVLSTLLNKAKGGFQKLGQTTGGIKENLSDLAAKRLNKASPTTWRKAVEEHGMDLNALTKKYFPKGGNYDDLLGPLKDRGTGGILGNTMKEAEKKITGELASVSKGTVIPIDDFVKTLTQEKNRLAKLPGNENNIAAMTEFIKGLAKKYGKGITPKAMLELKRVADSKFGQAVTDELTGSAVAQSQKMIANASRAKLKQLFPTIADALATESEVYTLQPIMSHARAILNTGGSEIRLGALRGGIGELFNPLNLLDAYLAKPEHASKFLQTAAKEVGQEAVDEAVKTGGKNLFSNLMQIVGRTAGTTTMVGVDQKQQDVTDQGGQTDENKQITDISQIPSDTSTIAEKPTNIFGGMTKEEFLQGAFMSGMTMAQLKELGQVYDMMVPEDKQKDQKVSATAQNQINLAEAGLKGLKDAQAIFNEDPTIVYKGAITAGLFSRKFEAALGRAIEGVLRARSGAAVPDSEVKKYRQLYGPQVGDTKEVALYKLQALQQDLEGIVSGNTGANYSPDITAQ